MANQKISTLTNSLTKATVATSDILPIVDTSATETKKMTYGEAMSPIDSVFRIAGSADNTKLVAFEVDGLTTATTRTLTVPDADMTLVGLTTTQTLTNKTLTSPQINFGSDANGDLIYRNGSGVTARLAIGTTDQILAVQSGLPAWIANPSASAASSTAAGIVELATTAETTTGTDATRAVTPQGLHDMTSLSGAAWFLDEDTMSSDSATKVPSQQSVKAYVGSQGSYFGGVGDATTSKTYHSFMLPWILSTDVPTGNFWTTTTMTVTSHWGSAEFNQAGGDATNAVLTTQSIGSITTGGATTGLTFAHGKDVICEFTMQRNAVGSEQMGWGLAVTTAPFIDYDDASQDAACFTVDASGNLYGHTSNGDGTTNHTETLISGVTLTNNNTYRIEFNAGIDVKFYVNGVLKATNATHLPSAGLIKFGNGCQGNTGDNDRASGSAPWFAIEK